MKSTCSVILLFLTCLTSEAQVVLRGEAPTFSGKSISVFEYEDFFTRKRHEVFSQAIDSKRGFDLKCTIDKPKYIEIFLNGMFSGVYVQPGFTYELQVDQKGKVISINSTDLTNKYISLYENRIVEFIKANNNKKNYYSRLEEFLANEKLAVDTVSRFAAEILSYRMASFQFNIYEKRKDSTSINLLEKSLLINRSINTRIPDYFNFMKHYAFNRGNSNFAIRRVPLDFSRPLKTLLDEMASIPSDSIQQLAQLAILRKAYRSEWSGPKEHINYLVDSIHGKATHPLVKKIAGFVKNDGNSLAPGSRVDDFSFVTHSGDFYKLSSFKGKYVLVDFWFTGCGPCLKTFPRLRELKRQYSDRIEIISLTPRDTQEGVTSFLKKHPDYTWKFSVIDNNDEMLQYFNVFVYPTYILIDPEGKIVKLIGYEEMEKNLPSVAALIK